MGGSKILKIKTNKRGTLKNHALDTLLLILINGPKSGTLEAWKMIKQVMKARGELKRLKETPMVKEKGVYTQTAVTDIQTIMLNPNRKLKHRNF